MTWKGLRTEYGKSSLNGVDDSKLSRRNLLLFNYAGEGLSLEDFNEDKPKKIGESWDRFTRAYCLMSYVLREYVDPSLGNALDSLFVNLSNIHSKYRMMKTSAIIYVTQQLLGQLRTMELMPDRATMNAEVVRILKLEEGSQTFHTIFNQELMGLDGDGAKRTAEQDNSPPERETSKDGSRPNSPDPPRGLPLLCLDQAAGPLQGADLQCG